MTLILGLESSCDDSAAALVTSDRQILAQAVVGQNARAPALWRRGAGNRRPRPCRDPARPDPPGARRRQAVASTTSTPSPPPPGPGLIGGVMVALLAGKGLALATGKPLIAVNHLEGHALSPAPGRSGPRFPLSAAAGLGRALPVARSARRRRLPAAGDDHRRRGRRSVRQDRQAARPALSRRPGDRGSWPQTAMPRPFRCRARCSARATAFLLRRPQERGPARGRVGRAPAAKTSPPASSRR